jgi:hypothetical protein
MGQGDGPAQVVPRVYVTSRGHAGMSFGCLGTIVIGFLYVMGAVLLVGLAAGLIGLWLLVYLGAWAALGIDRLLVATSQRWRARRAARGPFEPVLRFTSGTQRAASRGRRAAPGYRR